ncbi:MAG: hypothetical protein Q4F05_17220 [bacterium]|nr:hypothetical protein [bacterium]
MKKFLKASSLLGLLLFSVYSICRHTIGEPPDIIAYPIMLVSVILMIIGVAYDFRNLAKSKKDN